MSTDLSKKRYPAIAKAALEMSYDNGGINRDRTEADMFEELERKVLYDADIFYDLQEINAWLATLDDEQMQTVVAGEQSDEERILVGSPPGTDALLDRIFIEVC